MILVNQDLCLAYHDAQEYLIRQVLCLRTKSGHKKREAVGEKGQGTGPSWGGAVHRRM